MRLILPVLVPSWRFFRAVEPSPRVQWSFVGRDDGAELEWCEFHPRPQVLSWPAMVRRLLWNPAWNEALYLVTCAERLQQAPSDDIIAEIRQRVAREIAREVGDAVGHEAQFRLIFVHHNGVAMVEDQVYLSERFPAVAGMSA